MDAPAEDGPDLPRGCAPYLPCSVDVVLAAISEAAITEADVFVDIGSGVGKVGLLVRLLTGAAVIGIEVQSSLVELSKRYIRELNVERCATICGDASELARYIPIGSVFFFYCPFSGIRLNRVVDDLEGIAKMRPLRLCGVHTEFPERTWLHSGSRPRTDLLVCRAGRCRVQKRA